MQRKLIYVAGPFRAKTPWGIECNIRNAEEAGLHIALCGDIPVIPHTMYRFFQDSLPDDFWLDATMDLLKKCDGIYMLKDWKKSTGARAEYEWARANGLLLRFEE